MSAMIDAVFEIRGTSLPRHYQGELWSTLAGCLPWLESEPLAGLLEIRASLSGGTYLLPRRARLGLRVPVARADDAMSLSGREFEVGGQPLSVGRGLTRALVPQPTLGTPFLVTGARDELEHQTRVAELLERIGLPQRFICGRMGESPGAAGETLRGAPVVLHQLRDEQSMRVQFEGLGPNRSLGFGLFAPRKLISGIE
ncbi:MAG TPA: type I-MYXAN CRISPR-associated protein Cas6/Cmx6 [Burkholderiaceae bacterium]